MQAHIIISDGEKSVTIYRPGQRPLIADEQHPNFEGILAAIEADDESNIEDLFDATIGVAAKFQRLSRRVTAAHGRLFLDGDEVANALTRQVLRFLDEGVEDWKPLVAYFEKVLANPSQNSREQLFSFIDRHDVTILSSGDLVFYKGVERADDGYRSIRSGGTVIVDGTAVSGQVPNNPGSVVEMPRRDVADAPHVGCSVGLHVGTFDYAKGWGHGLVLEVHVDPADVVSVPVDSDYQKVRTCRYRIEDVIEVAYNVPVIALGLADWDDEDEDDEPYCECGLSESECEGCDDPEDDDPDDLPEDIFSVPVTRTPSSQPAPVVQTRRSGGLFPKFW